MSSAVLVGSNVSLKGKGLGSVVDQYTHVIRVNSPPQEYAEDVGTKITHWANNTLHQPVYGFDMEIWVYWSSMGEAARERTSHPVREMVNEDTFRWFLAEIHGIPTTGFMALLTAMALWGSVDLLGFGIPNSKTLGKPYYPTGGHHAIHHNYLWEDHHINNWVSQGCVRRLDYP